MAITFDPKKRAATLAERGLDVKDAELIFAGPTLEVEDTRKSYGEPRIICFGSCKAGLSWLAIRRVARIATSSA